MESKTWTRGSDVLVQIEEARKLAAHFDAVTAGDLSKNVVVGVGPLIEIAWPRSAEVLRGCRSRSCRITDRVDGIFRQTKRFLRIGAQFVPAPAGRVDPRLIQQCGRKGVIPDERKRVVRLRMVP